VRSGVPWLDEGTWLGAVTVWVAICGSFLVLIRL
jgi:hypothetical protein